MPTSLEARSLAYALLISLLSMGGAWLISDPIKAMTNFTPTAEEAFPEIKTSPELVNQGHEFFGQSCSLCHGDDAHGDEGPDLHHLSISNARIATTIKKGVKGEMPAFAKKYDDHQVAALISYLHSLR